MNEESILVVHEVVENIKLQLSRITQQINSFDLNRSFSLSEATGTSKHEIYLKFHLIGTSKRCAMGSL